MKKTLLVLFIMLVSLMLFAEELGSSSKVITAYKRHMTEGQIPAEELTLRLIDSNNNEFYNNSEIGLPLDSRNTDYPAFSWVFSGNVFTAVKMELSFGPMYWEANNESTSIIPYDITLSHTSTRVGNTSIPINKASTVTTYITNDFASGYYFKYADSVTFSSSTVSVTNTVQTITLTSNMKTNTIIHNSSGADVKSSYTLDVCDYWNRLGNAIIKLKITSDGKQVGGNTAFEEGYYYANVQVVLSKV